ncbi:hypothetical protein CTAYLR_001036 [Chrysophaeum taylorii]|uniref:Uncharacterized protein n=1 Tax=Chrysophaeum taylorii TaxID=2483200 RepID=A0AAD7XMQ8_9STRA|nr:hypothetical protein CTAYLR_001036 [Chrysophaeum taylorii]
MESGYLTLGDLTAASTSSARAREELEAKSRLKKTAKKVETPPSEVAEKAASRAETYASTVARAAAWEPLVREEARSENVVFGRRERATSSLGGLSAGVFEESAWELSRAVREQTSDLAQAQSALHHAGQKAKYHSGVKSKAYARGRKKKTRERRERATEAAAAADPEARKKLDEQRALARVRERTTLRHNSTSAWARGLKKRGRGATEGHKDAAREQLEIGQELRRKQDDVVEEEEEEEEATAAPVSKVFSMEFMRRAEAEEEAEERRRAEREAKELAAELDESEDLEGIRALAGEGDKSPPTLPFAEDRFAAGSLQLRNGSSWRAVATRAVAATRAVVSTKAVSIADAATKAVAKKADDRAVAAATKTIAEKKKKRTKPALDMTQEELVDLAFDTRVEEEFAAEKSRVEEEDHRRANEDETPALAGWGTWTGEGVPEPKKKKRKDPPVSLKKKPPTSPHVILNPKTIKKRAKLSVAQVPYPFTSRAQYEKYMGAPVGEEWNTKEAVAALTKPAVSVLPGPIGVPSPEPSMSGEAAVYPSADATFLEKLSKAEKKEAKKFIKKELKKIEKHEEKRENKKEDEAFMRKAKAYYYQTLYDKSNGYEEAGSYEEKGKSSGQSKQEPIYAY